jgi:spermidine synthase
VAQPARVAELAQRLNSLFRIVRVYTMYIPLYGSLWAMAVCSDKLDPKAFTADEIDRRIDARKLQELRFYNGETHDGVFALPNFVRETQERYDLISLDLNDPVGPAAALYSLEFFQQLRTALAPGGALTLHLGSPVAQPQRVADLAQRFATQKLVTQYYTPDIHVAAFAMPAYLQKLVDQAK